MTALYLYDDARARTFEPFALTRPVSELRAGAEVIRRRWERVTATRASGFIGAPHMMDFEEFDAPLAIPPETEIPAGVIIANSRCVVALEEILDTTHQVWICDGTVAAVRLSQAIRAADLSDGTLSLETLTSSSSSRPLHGRWLHEVWDLIAHLSTQLTDDIAAIAPTFHSSSLMHDGLGPTSPIVEEGVTVEPYVIFDTRPGPILIRRGTTISAFTRITGPCYIGEDVTIVGDRVANCSIGELSKIRGEISSSIVLGHSNKGHTGFVGHSYLGRWVNLGAGTTTSNLKNTYGTVQLWTPTGLRDTQQQFIGTFFGDHVKTGIGTMLTTGTVLGCGANVYGAAGPPKYVAPFAWGDGEPYQTFAADKFVRVAGRVMQRRHVTLGERQQRHLGRVHALSRRSEARD
ncbi:MAG TPA: putative sugar nucleotidyl transferase [Gemmatimonadaceae bacterium]|jgi:UDP-N-acetylglucosamine diphosphorylase/glucosamine-1-phosphate N-acetyltransferase|nr:putative sugar nucleotidyl transferase [Gemmatimonadaceae bacterium]